MDIITNPWTISLDRVPVRVKTAFSPRTGGSGEIETCEGVKRSEGWDPQLIILEMAGDARIGTCSARRERGRDKRIRPNIGKCMR